MKDHDYAKILEAIEGWHFALKTLTLLGVFRSRQWVADYGEGRFAKETRLWQSKKA